MSPRAVTGSPLRRLARFSLRLLPLVPAAPLPLLLCGAANQSALRPSGIQAGRIEHTWWLFFIVCVIVYLVVMALILWSAVVRRRRTGPEGPAVDIAETDAPRERERRLVRSVSAATIATAVILLGLLIVDLATDRALESLASTDAPVVIQVTGHQWWWEFRYDDSTASNIVTTANEVHIPVGRPVRFNLRSADVIHSFWVPNLNGKKDLIPGHPASLTLRADVPGTYGGQCAEYCGLQHATMRFAVVAEDPARFEAWLAAQRSPAPEPLTESERRGREVFLRSTCIMCHSIQGTSARGRIGPDLTHIAGRQRLASGTLPNTRGYLAGWIVDPQHIRPGVRMPLNPLAPEDLQALLDYLETLK